MSSRKIYHERQESMLCGQHCLNNLLQGPHFSAVHLAEVANDIDEQERAIMDNDPSMRSESANVDDSGNFSIQVLRVALQRYHNVDLEHFPAGSDPLETVGFVVNLSDHWFTIRKIGERYWNLNSTLEKPQMISQFYLSAFLHELQTGGYSVFMATGRLPLEGNQAMFVDYLPQGLGTWYSEEDLLQPSGAPNVNQSASSPAAFTGVGRKLGGGVAVEEVDRKDFLIEGEYEDDEELLIAQAITASLESSSHVNQSAPADSGSTEKVETSSIGAGKRNESSAAAEMRAKRLAAFDKK